MELNSQKLKNAWFVTMDRKIYFPDGTYFDPELGERIDPRRRNIPSRSSSSPITQNIPTRPSETTPTPSGTRRNRRQNNRLVIFIIIAVLIFVAIFSGFSNSDSTLTVTFDPSGGSVNQTARTVQSRTAVGALPTPVRTGYSFNGWFTSATGGTQINADTRVNRNVVYIARWTPIPTPFTFQNQGGNLTITGYTGPAGVLSIPPTHNGNRVIAIGREAFRNRNITSITIPDSVRSIGLNAFANNPITSVTIGANVTLNFSGNVGILGQNTGFNGAYANNNSRAGTYTRSSAGVTEWRFGGQVIRPQTAQSQSQPAAQSVRAAHPVTQPQSQSGSRPVNETQPVRVQQVQPVTHPQTRPTHPLTQPQSQPTQGQSESTLGTVRWTLSDQRITFPPGDVFVYPKLFNEPIVNCTGFTIDFEYLNAINCDPYGLQRVFVMQSGMWSAVGSFNAPNKNKVTTTIRFNTPSTIFGIAIIPVNSGRPISGEWSLDFIYTPRNFIVVW